MHIPFHSLTNHPQCAWREVALKLRRLRHPCQNLRNFAYQPDLVVDHIGMIPDEFIFGRALACA